MRRIAVLIITLILLTPIAIQIGIAKEVEDPWVGSFIEYDFLFTYSMVTQPQGAKASIGGILRGEIVEKTSEGYVARYTIEIKNASVPLSEYGFVNRSTTRTLKNPYELVYPEQLGGRFSWGEVNVISHEENVELLGVSNRLFKGSTIQVLGIRTSLREEYEVSVSLFGAAVTLKYKGKGWIINYITPLGIPYEIFSNITMKMTGGALPGQAVNFVMEAKMKLLNTSFDLTFGETKFYEEDDSWYFISYSPTLDLKDVKLSLDEKRLTAAYGGYGNFSVIMPTKTLDKTGASIGEVVPYVDGNSYNNYYGYMPSAAVSGVELSERYFSVIVYDLPKPEPYYWISVPSVLTVVLSKDAEPVVPSKPVWVPIAIVAIIAVIVVAVAVYIVVKKRRARTEKVSEPT